jgi:uncharacterized protein YwgA
MSASGKYAKELSISRKSARKLKKSIDRTVKETNKNLRLIGKKLIFERPEKGGRRRFVDAV